MFGLSTLISYPNRARFRGRVVEVDHEKHESYRGPTNERNEALPYGSSPRETVIRRVRNLTLMTSSVLKQGPVSRKDEGVG